MKENQLPDKPSELILLALSDLEAVEQNPLYRVNMAMWHMPAYNACEVCLAGAVMAQTLGENISMPASPDSFYLENKKLSNKLAALNEFREGYIFYGLGFMGIKLPDGCDEEHSITPYEEDPDKFKTDMRGLAEYLKTFDL